MSALVLSSPDTVGEATLLACASEHLVSLAPIVALADPEARVRERSRMLCAGLAVLARACLRALAGPGVALGEREREVGDAAAMLALLTKIDDQVIDDRRFHGGPLLHRDPLALDRRTRAYLAPTLRSICTASPADATPRCSLAARLGASLRLLACSRERLEHVLDIIAFGWEVQVRAVRLLSSPPAHVDPAAIRAVSADISGAWLLMVTAIGELPAAARRSVSSHEEAAFYRWGLAIQAADALADLDKDTADGLVASWPGVLLDACEPGRERWRRAYAEDDARELLAGMIEHAIEPAILPSARERLELDATLAELGAVPHWLAWIHDFLLQRWRAHPLGLASSEARYVAWSAPTREAACSAR